MEIVRFFVHIQVDVCRKFHASPYPLSSFATTCCGSWPLKVRFIFKNFLIIVMYNLMFYSSENGKSTSYWN